ncbi:MAG: chromate transporter [Tissierellia bacterium]|nr:chromate transporter [Tissierellia bacterium]
MLLSLYLVYFQIGAMAFGGGYATIPLIQEFIVEQKGWVNMTTFTDLVVISQMTPGPIAINAATFVGAKVGGLPGSLLATLGAISPQSILMSFLGYKLFTQKKQYQFLGDLLRGIKPGTVGLIFIAATDMLTNSIFPGGLALSELQIPALVCFVVGLILYIKRVDLIKLIVLGGIIGIVLELILA